MIIWYIIIISQYHDNIKILIFLVDIFHVSKHTEEACMPPENPNCLYHPHLPQFDEISGVNTESCEQGFKRLNQYFELPRKMTQFKRNVLFWFVNECFNTDLEAELKRKSLLEKKGLYSVIVFMKLFVFLIRSIIRRARWK